MQAFNLDYLNDRNPHPPLAMVKTQGALSPDAVVVSVIQFVLANVAENINLDALAAAAGLSRFTFTRRFHKECGLSPMRWLWTFRAVLAAELIGADPYWSLTDVAFTCGFSSSSHFCRAFKDVIGVSPSVHKRKVASALQASAAANGPISLPGDFSIDLALRAVANVWTC